MDELIAFVVARLDEDEAAAKHAAGATNGHWIVTDQGRIVRRSDTPGKAAVLGDLWNLPTAGQAAHIARHDPARVLREVAAKRAMIDNYRRAATACLNATGAVLDTPGYAEIRGARDAFRAACTDLAAVYSDHPDYRAEWAA